MEIRGKQPCFLFENILPRQPLAWEIFCSIQWSSNAKSWTTLAVKNPEMVPRREERSTPSSVDGEQISAIGRGICVLLGISVEDTQKDAEYMVRKILNLRVFDDENGKAWSKSVMDKQFEVLCISQFTLQCVLKGNKPDYHLAMPSEHAEPFYNDVIKQLRKAYKPELVKDGKFGAYMQVHIQNDGPVTIELEPPAQNIDPKHLAKLEKQQQRKEKSRAKGPSESTKERSVPRSKDDPSASSGADGDVSSEREP